MARPVPIVLIAVAALAVGLGLAWAHGPARSAAAPPSPVADARSGPAPTRATVGPPAVSDVQRAFTRLRPGAPPVDRVALIDASTALVTIRPRPGLDRVFTLRRHPAAGHSEWQIDAVLDLPPALTTG